LPASTRMIEKTVGTKHSRLILDWLYY